MKGLFKTVGLVARYDKKRAIQLAQSLSEYLKAKGLKVYVENTLGQAVRAREETIPLEQMKTDFIITIGGDGTILRTCISIPKPEPPILTINLGIRGFLTEVEPKQAFEAVDKCLKGKYEIEKCMKLSATTNDESLPAALNEVVVTHDEPAKLLYTRILKNDEVILDCHADSLLISSQTGSTGYSLSAGGPVLDLGVDAFVLTPICPLTDFHPVVFPADSKLRIEIIRPKKVLVLVDGQYSHLVSSRCPSVTVTRSEHTTTFIRFRENFYHRLRSRLLFKGMR